MTAGTATSALTAGQLALVDGADWESVALPGGAGVPAVSAGELAYVVQGSFYSKDTIGNNPGHGGYKESVKSKELILSTLLNYGELTVLLHLTQQQVYH